MLESLGFDAFKIASGDLTYDGLIAAAAAHRRAARHLDRHERRSTRCATRVQRRPRGRRRRRRRAALRVGLSDAAARREPARHSDAGRRVRRAGRAVRPRPRSGVRGRGRGARRRPLRAALRARRRPGRDRPRRVEHAGRTSRPSSRRCADTRAALGDGVKALPPVGASRIGCRAGAGSTPRARSPPGTSCAPSDFVALRPGAGARAALRARSRRREAASAAWRRRGLRRGRSGRRRTGREGPRMMPLNVLITAASRRVPLVAGVPGGARHARPARAASSPPTSTPIAGRARGRPRLSACRWPPTRYVDDAARHLRGRAHPAGRADHRRRADARSARPASGSARSARSPPARPQPPPPPATTSTRPARG